MPTVPPKAGNEIFHLAFDNSAQPNIISIISTGKIIIANNAACKLLGYSRKALLTMHRNAIFDINDRNFKKMLKERTAEGQSVATVKLFRKSGKTILCQISSAVFTGEDRIKKSITAITNLTERNKQQQEIDTKKDKIISDNIDIARSEVADNIKIASDASDSWIKYIAKASYDVMWDWNIVSGNVYIGDSIEEIFGYKIKNNNIAFAKLKKALLTTDSKQVLVKLNKVLKSTGRSWSDSFLINRLDGTLASVDSRGTIVRDGNGKAVRMIGATIDLSKLRELEKETDQRFQLAARLSYDGIWDWNIITNEFFLGEGFEHLFGEAFMKENDKGFNWSRFLHPEDREAVEKGFAVAIASGAMTWEHAYRFIKPDGTVANVYGRASIIRDEEGKATRMIGAIHDLSRQRDLEEKLEMELRLKEKQIDDATQDGNESARSDIGKELHDNVNQLLGVSKMYLELAQKGGPDSDLHLTRSSSYTMDAIEAIRKLSKGLSTDSIQLLGLCATIENLAVVTMEIHPVNIRSQLDPLLEKKLNEKFKLNLFRIIQEQLNNIVKHAAAKKISIQLSQNENSIILEITDDGIGFDTNKKRKGVGLDNIKSRAAAFNGNTNFISAAGKGCTLNIVFTVTDSLLQKI